jgi:hypothetical protein
VDIAKFSENSLHSIIQTPDGFIIYDSVSGFTQKVNEAELGGVLDGIIKIEESINLNQEYDPGLEEMVIEDKYHGYEVQVKFDRYHPQSSIQLCFYADSMDEGKRKIENVLMEMSEQFPRFFRGSEPAMWAWDKEIRYMRPSNSVFSIIGLITPEVFGLTFRCLIKSFNMINDRSKNKLYTLYLSEALCSSVDKVLP